MTDPTGGALGRDDTLVEEAVEATLAGPPDRSELRRRTARGVAWMGLSTAGQAVLQLVFVSLLARLVVPAEFGLVSGALIAVYFTTVLAESGVGAAIVQRTVLAREHIRVAYTISVGLGVLCWAVLAAIAPQIEDLLRLPGLTPILRVVALIFIINNLTLSDYLLARRLQFRRLAFAESTAYAVGYGGVAITMAAMGYGAWSIVGGQLAQSSLRTILVTCLAPHSILPSFRRGPAKELLSFGAGYSIGRIGLWASSQVDNLVVGRYLGPASLGLYGRAYQLVQLPANVFGQVANEVLFPAMATVKDDRGTLRRLFRLGIGFMAALALPVSVLAAVTSKSLVLVLLGKDWLPLRAAFDIIIFGLLFRTCGKLIDALTKATGAVNRRAWRSLLFALLVFAGAFIGQRWGLHGVAIGVFAALTINYLVTSQLCLSLVEMRRRDFALAHVPGLILSVVAGAVGLLAESLLKAAGVSVFARLAIVWFVAIGSVLGVIRIAWRLSVLASIVELVASVCGFLHGKPARVVSRLLGPGYAVVLRPSGAPLSRQPVRRVRSAASTRSKVETPGAQGVSMAEAVRRHLVVVLLCTAAIGGIAMALVPVFPPRHTAVSQVLLGSETDLTLYGRVVSNKPIALADTAAQTMLSEPVLLRASQLLGGKLSPQKLGASVSVLAAQDNLLVSVTATASSVTGAEAIADAEAQAYLDVTKQRLTNRRSDIQNQLSSQRRSLSARLDVIQARESAIADPVRLASLLLPAADQGDYIRAALDSNSEYRILRGQAVSLDTQLQTIDDSLQQARVDANLLQQGVNTMVAATTAEDNPVSIALKRNLVFGLALGLVLGIAVAWRRSESGGDDQLSVAAVVLGAPLIGWLPKPAGGAVSAYAGSDARVLMATVQLAAEKRGLNTVVVIELPRPSSGNQLPSEPVHEQANDPANGSDTGGVELRWLDASTLPVGPDGSGRGANAGLLVVLSPGRFTDEQLRVLRARAELAGYQLLGFAAVA
jgi:O-antigen/teichoic acid export membrane protein/capsular polysaccharide biosynthesis protein